MAIVDVKVPQFSESVEEGTLISWKKKPGEAVAVDEVLVEIETDKVVLEVPAPSAGVLAEVLVADGATVTSEQLLAKIDTEGKAGAAAPAAAVGTAQPHHPQPEQPHGYRVRGNPGSGFRRSGCLCTQGHPTCLQRRR